MLPKSAPEGNRLGFLRTILHILGRQGSTLTL